jgi:hypothetical protein
MRTLLQAIIVLGFLGFVSWLIADDFSPAPEPAAAITASWRAAPIWDDGRAEFSAYDVEWPRYGHRFDGGALLVLVKEPWAPDLDVKADRPRRDGFDVLKLNHVRDVRTGIYTYHQMASVFFRRDDGTLRKIAAASTEACGVATAHLRDGKLETHSYFDGQGDRTVPYPGGALPEDGLPALLRDWVTVAPPAEVLVFPSLLMGRYGELAPRRYRVERRPVADVAVPAGRFDAVELRLAAGDDLLTYAFERAAPHRLVRFQRSDGTEYRLAKSERLAYWKLHGPGDEGWWDDVARRRTAGLVPGAP